MTAERIHPDLASLAVEISSLTPDPRNARLHDKRNLAEIAASYSDHGQVKPIVCSRETRQVLAGNGQLEAAKMLGWRKIAAVFLDDDAAQQRKFKLRDNRTAELAHWDVEVLALEFKELDALGIDLVTLGWTEVELEPFLAATFQRGQADASESSGTDEHTGKRVVTFSTEEWARMAPKLALVRGDDEKLPDAEVIVRAVLGPRTRRRSTS